MALLVIPTQSDLPDRVFPITLNGQVYRLRFRYNFRMARWIMDVADRAGEVIVAGMPLLAGTVPNLRFRDSRLPPGLFEVFDQRRKGLSPERHDLGRDVLLLYLEAATA